MAKIKKVKKERDFDEYMHTQGRIWTACALILMLFVPVAAAIYLNSMPNLRGLFIGMATIGVIFIPTGIIEVITYAPMLGTGATYLAFVTGNLSNLKIPCVMNSRTIVGTEFGTKENEIISTLSVAVSALVTSLVLVVGVLLLVPLTPVLMSQTLQPAFGMVVPALFGALGYQYFSKGPKLAIAPLTAMILLCLFVPAAAAQVGVLVPIAALIAMGAARVMFKKGMIS